ncbi:MAG: SDR family NAD(P)-dependent oxidoreductase, partial [Candidatus Binatia bacterium]
MRTALLQGKVVLVTGSSRGIGAAAAKRMAEWGARVVVNYKNSESQARALLDEIRKAGGQATAVRADVTQRAEVEAMDRSIRAEFGPPDVVVNNAYFPFSVGLIHELSWEKLKQAVEEELSALHHCIQVFSPAMIEKKKGKFIVVSSRVAHQPLPRLGAHGAAKAALETMANTAAIELGPLGITVNIISPGFTLTEASSIMPEAFKQRILQT